MPTSENQRRAAYAELGRRKEGKTPRSFAGMGTKKLEKYVKEPLHKPKKGGKK